MAQFKIHEKNVAVFGKVETTEGTYAAPANTDALLATSMDGSVTYETGTYQYLGDSLSRNELSYLKDTFADFTLETPQQVLGNLDTGRSVADVPMSAWFRACGGSISVNGSTGAVTITNSSTEDSSISIDYRKTSASDSVNQKLFKFLAVRGMVDVNASVKEIPKLKFSFKGNAVVPEQAAYVTPNFGNQDIYVAATVRPENIVYAEITPILETFDARSTISGSPTIAKSGTTATVTLASHGLVTGQRVNISGCSGTDGAFYNGDFVITKLTDNTFTYIMQGTPSSSAAGTIVAKKDGYKKTFCFGNLTANNFFGFDYARFMTGCEEGFSKSAVPTDVSVTFIEGPAAKYKATSITKSTNTATVTVAGHGLNVGDIVTISGATGNDAAYYNGSFPVASVADSSHFTYLMSGTPASDAATTDGIYIVNTYQATFNPEAEVLNYFKARVKVGTGNGRYVTYSWSKLQLSNVKDGKVDQFFGKDITFRNTGTSSIILE